MPRVNPDILAWARETANLTPEEAVKKLGLEDSRGISALEKLQQLEDGEVEPSRPMIMKMVKAYRRSLLVFYMSKPPRKSNRGQDFRTLPANYSPHEDALIDMLIRDILVRQGMLRSLIEDDEDAEPLDFVGSMILSAGTEKAVNAIQNILGIDHTDFYAQPNRDKAFTLLREKAESSGVIVLLIGDLGSHHTKIEPESFRGFALADKMAPFIIINDHDSHAAWSFTLIHELTHILLGQSGISGGWAEKQLERFCNDVASEFLLPSNEIEQLILDTSLPLDEQEDLIAEFAGDRNLSNSMVAYKLYRLGILEPNAWSRINRDFRERWRMSQEAKREELAEKDKNGPSYYIVRRHRLGNTLIHFIDRMIASGSLTTSKAGKILGVKPKNVRILIDMVRSS